MNKIYNENLSEINIGPRIKEVRLAKGLTQKAFADSLGIVQGFLSGLERGKKVPSDTLLIALCHLYGINTEWLQTGCGEMFSAPASQKNPAQNGTATTTPLLRNVSMGFPDEIKKEDLLGDISLGDVPAGCYAIVNYGDFMAPTIRDGDLVIFQPGREVQNKDIVLVHNRWGEAILRRYRLKGSEVFFSPENPAYSPFKPDPDTKIFGKVVAVWRKIKL